MKNPGLRAVIRSGSVLILPILPFVPIPRAVAASPANYVLTVESSSPATGIIVAASPKDQSGKSSGTTKFTLVYAAGASVTLTAPAKSGGESFASWAGCATASGLTCKVSMTADKTVTVKYSPTTYVLTVGSSDPASGVSIKVSSSSKQCSGSKLTTFHCTLDAGTVVTLTAPQKADDHSFGSWLGCSNSNSMACTVKLDAKTTVTAYYNAPGAVTPTVNVSPSVKSVSTAQPPTVKIGVSGAAGKPVPQGWVTLESGNFGSAATTLSKGKATIMIPAGALAAGKADKLTATYTPNAASSSTYKSASGSALVTVTVPTYKLTIDSAYPGSGVYITANPADIHNVGYAATPFTLTYDARTPVQLTPSPSSDGYSFLSWSGCASTTKAGVCNVTVKGNMTVTANYSQPNVTGVKITPNPATAIIGTPLQLTARVLGSGSISTSVNWSLAGQGTLTQTSPTTATYVTPYPVAEPPSVQITATSTETPSVGSTATVALNAPATAAGPTLAVDVNTPNTPSENPHKISPLVYGMNGYLLDSSSAAIAHPGVVRWGGDDTSRYNYRNNMTNSAADYYFESFQGAAGMPGSGNFTDFISANVSLGAETLGTVPVLGWVTNSTQFACSFTQSQFPGQESYNGNSCGNGEYPDGVEGCEQSGGCELFGNNTIAAITSYSEPAPSILDAPAPSAGASALATWAEATWTGGWVNSLVTNSNFGPASGGKGVNIWDLDNEPAWWDAVHRDVHPSPSTYDEVTNGGIGTALAIKTADPSAQVGGPVIDYWWNYFYSKKDIENGWNSGPCYEPWDNPTDREAHGGAPMIEYYLQQFNKYSQSYGIRLLDYVDIHGYFAPDYPPNSGNSVAFTTAGDTGEQEARMNGTRVFWDPTYTDADTGFNQPYPQPNYITDSNYTQTCPPPAQAPQVIPMLQSWVNNDYPGTGTSIDEYNFGGMESINGAVVEADILGIFGRQNLSMSALWPSENYNGQVPGNYAFAMYRNYDGNDSTFGDTYLYATSANSGADAENQLAVYAAQRSSDHAITVMVINKTYGALNSVLSLQNLAVPSGTQAQVYQYSNANLNQILTPASLLVIPPASGGTTSTIKATFPGQSITLLVIPNP
jgi:hypothetical protein